MNAPAATDGSEPFSSELERWLRSDAEKTLRSLTTVFAERSFAVAILLLMFVPALPLPTGGVTHLFEAVTILLALQMVFGRTTVWLPERLRDRPLGATTTDRAIPFMLKWVRRAERISRPRGRWLFQRALMLRFCGLLLIGLALAAALAPPFSGLDTLPAMGAIAVALAILLEDVLILAIGVVLGATGVALIVTVGAAIARILRGLL